MPEKLISKREAEAALEKALREGWITPEQAAEMRMRNPTHVRAGRLTRHPVVHLLVRWFGRDRPNHW